MGCKWVTYTGTCRNYKSSNYGKPCRNCKSNKKIAEVKENDRRG